MIIEFLIAVFKRRIISFTFFIWLSFAGFLYAQNTCECPIEEDLGLGKLKFEDSLSVFKTVNLLKSSASKTCHYEAANTEFNFYLKRNNFSSTLTKLQKQETLLKNIDCKGDYLYRFLFNKIKYYQAIKDLENLSKVVFEALEEAENLEDIEKEIESIQTVVLVFTRMNEDHKNWDYIKRAEALIHKVNNQEKVVSYNRWLAFQYENKYVMTERSSLLDSALMFINKTKKDAARLNLTDELAQSYRVLEACAYHNGNLEQALIFADSAIYFAKQMSHKENMGPYYLSKAWDHLDLKQFEKANKWMDSALFYDENKGSAANMMMHFEASNIYEGAGYLPKAFGSFKTYIKMKDSILNLETVEKVNELEQKYNKVKNEQKIFQLEKEKQFYLLLILVSFLAILSLVLLFRQRLLRNKQKQMETEQRLNRARINPHFFFNAMAFLQTLFQQEKKSDAVLYTSRLSKIMRMSLESTYEELTTVESEIDFLTQYLELQKSRHPNKFDYQFHLENPDINELKIPGMLIQPFVENAIEHGFKGLQHKGNIFMNFEELTDSLQIIIEDNGKGNSQQIQKREHKSRAMQIVKDRLELFNKKHGAKAFYKVEKPSDSTGFKIVIHLPKLF